MIKYYTIYLGEEIWTNVIDDMNSTSDWAIGGMVWQDKEKAERCMESLKSSANGFEDEGCKFKVVELLVNI